MSTNKENVSTIFLLPGIEIKRELKLSFYNNGFVNTFLTCKGLSYPFEVIFLLFNPKQIDINFCSFIEDLKKNTNFLEVLDVGLNKILLVYRIPKKFRLDYNLFLEGKYSELSEEYKKCFSLEKFKLDGYGNKVIEKGKYIMEPSNFYHIFNKTEHLKNIWLDKLGISKEESHILDNVELYEKQDTIKEDLQDIILFEIC